jgi:hypothetical protein
MITAAPGATIRDLIAALRAAGWRHRVEWEEGARDWETGAPEDEGYRTHTWSRGLAAIQVCQAVDDGALIGAITHLQDADDDALMIGGADPRLSVGVGWVEAHGAAALCRLADAAGILAGAR